MCLSTRTVLFSSPNKHFVFHYFPSFVGILSAKPKRQDSSVTIGLLHVASYSFESQMHRIERTMHHWLSEHKFEQAQETVKGSEAWHAAVHGSKESDD